VDKLDYIQFGMGPIGCQVARYLLEREGARLTGAIDIDPDKVGRDAGEILGCSEPLGVAVSDDAEAVLAASDAGTAILTTLSSFAAIEEQLLLCVRHGKHVITSCEELAWPWDEDPERAARVDAAAREAGVAVLATGVNPGFAMDALPAFLTGVCREMNSIRIERHQDAGRRRLPFQRKVGAGLSLEEFRRQVAAGKIRHVGFRQSLQMIAAALGWELERVEERVEPAIAERELESSFLKVNRGEAAGVLQTATGFRDGRPVITLELQAYLDHPEPKDAIHIEGEPSFSSEIRGGLNGDIATCAMLANAVPVVSRAQPGLRTMLDVGLTSWFGGVRR